jgi:two-component system, LytTR family, response regulator
MSPLRVVIVEDQLVARDHLVSLLAAEPDVEIVAVCETARAAIAAVSELAPDAVFLDLDMHDVDGSGVVETLGRDRMPLTIVLTAHEDGALRAFDVSAFDCLLKPFGRDRLRAALARVRTHVALAREHDLGNRLLALAHEAAPPHHLEASRFVVRSGGRVLFVASRDVDWIESDGNYVHLHAAGRTHVVRETLTNLERKLAARRFARIHRTRLVNLDRVRELRARGNGEYDVVMADGTRMRVGRAFRQELHRKLERG